MTHHPRNAAPAALLLVILLTACTAPGEPPSHPGIDAYHDVIRRELSTTTSALATMQLTLNYANHHRITQTYATTITNQAQADLNRVATDLNQISPPTRYTHPHQQLQHLTAQIAHQLATLTTHWNTPTRTNELHQLNAQSTTLDRLTNQLLS